MACLLDENAARTLPRPEGGWRRADFESALGGPVAFAAVDTPAGRYWLVTRADGVATERAGNVLAGILTMVPVHGPCVLVPPWEIG